MERQEGEKGVRAEKGEGSGRRRGRERYPPPYKNPGYGPEGRERNRGVERPCAMIFTLLGI